MKNYNSNVIVAGGGISGLITAYELLKKGKTVIIFDKDIEENLGGLAKEAAGGIHLIDSPQQKRLGVKDSKKLALSDWLRMAQFDEGEVWPRKWAEFYCYNSAEYIQGYYDEVGLKFITLLWPERGLYRPGNTVPRFHLTWGTGFELVNKTIQAINKLPQRSNLQILYEHEVNDVQQGTGCAILKGRNITNGETFEATGEQVIIASGGIGGGDLSELKKHWPGDGQKAPDSMLNGAHKFGDGLLHHKIEEQGGVLTNLKYNWPYSAGVHYSNPQKPFHGISLQPGPGILWFNALGERIGPQPLISLLDNQWLVQQILSQPGQYTWLILNWKLAIKDLSVALSRYFDAIRGMNKLLLIRNALLGDEKRIKLLLSDSPDDVFLADNLDDLMDKMQEKSLYDLQINREKLKTDVESYDDLIDRGQGYRNDEQLRQIANFRGYFPERFKTSNFKKILDPKNGPLMAIRCFIISRKSMGGIQTDMNCKVLKKDGLPFGNIYAVGEAAGFGGGGIHGKSAPEGSWLGGCILTARVCGRAID